MINMFRKKYGIGNKITIINETLAKLRNWHCFSHTGEKEHYLVNLSDKRIKEAKLKTNNYCYSKVTWKCSKALCPPGVLSLNQKFHGLFHFCGLDLASAPPGSTPVVRGWSQGDLSVQNHPKKPSINSMVIQDMEI